MNKDILKVIGGIVLGIFLFATTPLIPTTTAGMLLALACLIILKKESGLEKVIAYTSIGFFFPAVFVVFKQLGILIADVIYATAVVFLVSEIVNREEVLGEPAGQEREAQQKSK